MVERHVANVVVVGSNPISRSIFSLATGLVAFARSRRVRGGGLASPAGASERRTAVDEHWGRTARLAHQPHRRRHVRRSRAEDSPRPRRPDQRRRPLQEAPQGQHPPQRRREAVQRVARLDDQGSGRPRVPARSGPQAPRREAVPQAGRRPGQVDPPDGQPGTARRGAQAQPDHAARPRHRRDRAARRRADGLRDGRGGPPRLPAPGLQGLDRRVAGQVGRGRRHRRPGQGVPRAVRPDGPQVRGRGRGRRLHHRQPRLPPRREDLQRGQGNPVPAPARAAVPGRDRPGDRHRPDRDQARRVARRRRPDRQLVARPRDPGQDDQGDVRGPRPQDAPPARAERRVLPDHRLRRRGRPPRSLEGRSRTAARVPEAADHPPRDPRQARRRDAVRPARRPRVSRRRRRRCAAWRWSSGRAA